MAMFASFLSCEILEVHATWFHYQLFASFIYHFGGPSWNYVFLTWWFLFYMFKYILIHMIEFHNSSPGIFCWMERWKKWLRRGPKPSPRCGHTALLIGESWNPSGQPGKQTCHGQVNSQLDSISLNSFLISWHWWPLICEVCVSSFKI